MAVTQVYRVNWHWENAGKIVNNRQVDYVQAADSKFDTIRGVIVTNQAKLHGASTFVIDDVLNVGPGNISQ